MCNGKRGTNNVERMMQAARFGGENAECCGESGARAPSGARRSTLFTGSSQIVIHDSQLAIHGRRIFAAVIIHRRPRVSGGHEALDPIPS